MTDSVFFIVSAIALVFSVAAPSADAGRSHGPREPFYFGNHIDTHQVTRLRVEGGFPTHVRGAFLIVYTGDIDPASGLPVARHARGPEMGEVCGVDVECEEGWKIFALPGEATFLYHAGVNGDDHPVWMVNRIDIPQPGSFTHFHWITQTSDDPRSADVPDECNVEKAGQLDNNAENVVCPGWFLQIRAKKAFAFEHGGESLPLYPGVDNATHINLVTNYAEVIGITPTR